MATLTVASAASPPRTRRFDSAPSTGGPFSSITWDFGDGATGTGAAPSHTYAAAGTYSVVLTVENAAGSDTQTTSVVVT